MDEQTPHLHVTVVPIVTTERKRKASEARATKRYRTKPKNGSRLSADDIMTRENLTRFQDTGVQRPGTLTSTNTTVSARSRRKALNRT